MTVSRLEKPLQSASTAAIKTIHLIPEICANDFCANVLFLKIKIFTIFAVSSAQLFLLHAL